MIIIDAYNLFKQVLKTGYISDQEREKMIRRIAQYAHTKNLEISLVFDGGTGMWPEVYRRNGIDIIYVGMQMSADDYIKEYILRYMRKRQNKQYILVSSDRALYTFALRHGVTVIDSPAFYQLLEEALHAPEKIQVKKSHAPVRKLHPEDDSNPELDALMYGTNYVMDKDAVKTQEDRSARQGTKEEKRLLRIIKKL